MSRIVLATALLLLAACDRGPEAPPPPPAAKPPDFPPLPDFKASDEFSNDGFKELPAEGAAAFGWDLRENAHHNYSYEQESHAVMTAAGDNKEAKVTSRTQWKGAAEVIGGGGRGELNFLASPIAMWHNGQSVASEELNRIPKIVLRYLMKEDGALTAPQFISGHEDPMLDLFFALPSRELKEGEQEVKDVHMARLENSSKIHGRQEIVHAGRRKVGRHECVKFLSKVECEATPPGDGQGRLVGRVASYFDPKERKFVRVDASLMMAVDVRRETKPADPHAPAFWIMNRLQGDTRVTILLKD